MNSFTLRGMGYLPAKLEIMTKDRTTYVRFCLIGHNALVDEETGFPLNGQYLSTLWFAAFGAVGRRIIRYASKGDHLLVDAHLSPYDWTAPDMVMDVGYSWIVTDFKSGAYWPVRKDEPPPQPSPLADAVEMEPDVIPTTV